LRRHLGDEQADQVGDEHLGDGAAGFLCRYRGVEGGDADEEVEAGQTAAPSVKTQSEGEAEEDGASECGESMR
jgi:hypothetical protein